MCLMIATPEMSGPCAGECTTRQLAHNLHSPLRCPPHHASVKPRIMKSSQRPQQPTQRRHPSSRGLHLQVPPQLRTTTFPRCSSPHRERAGPYVCGPLLCCCSLTPDRSNHRLQPLVLLRQFSDHFDRPWIFSHARPSRTAATKACNSALISSMARNSSCIGSSPGPSIARTAVRRAPAPA